MTLKIEKKVPLMNYSKKYHVSRDHTVTCTALSKRFAATGIEGANTSSPCLLEGS